MTGARWPGWMQTALSAWLLFWCALIVVYNHAGAYAWAALAVLLGSVGWIVLARQTRMRGRAVLYGLAWSFLFGWMLATTTWGVHGPETAWRLAAQVVLMLSIPAYLLTRGEGAKTALAHILMATALAGAAALFADIASGFGLSLAIDPVPEGGTMWRRQSDAEMHLGRGQVAWTVLAPVLVGLFATRLSGSLRWVAVLAFLGLLLGSAWLNRLMIPFLILAGAVPAMLLARALPKLAIRLSIWLAAGTIALAPLLGWIAGRVPESVLERLPLSWDHRLRMWDYALTRTLERPINGHGLDASRAMQDSFTTRIGVDIPYISLHPHNVGLQVWLELGAFGALFATAAILTLQGPLQRLARGQAWRAVAVAGLVTGVAVASAVTVGAWQYWWWGLVFIAGTFVSLIDERAGLLDLHETVVDSA